jgi:hypothetical protein
MNKNVISLSLLVGVSAISDLILEIPQLELYEEVRVKEAVLADAKSLIQESMTKLATDALPVDNVLSSGLYIDENSVLTANSGGDIPDEVLLESVMNRINNSKSLEEEFAEVINENFWDLI